ncbi:hypothetical protein PISMIDRAFT_682904 [Pisolithus microcarpus 441]|uniref:Uncharacterized protein n=1 Tax=Pisolithus microcarpus 441 TaxID=765257 RepID=A0A0C9Z026_9AGAM|nr:hypothetical protein PISMIDRAFT_682904 [Pisolithus microcarpus 441]
MDWGQHLYYFGILHGTIRRKGQTSNRAFSKSQGKGYNPDFSLVNKDLLVDQLHAITAATVQPLMQS